MLLPEAAQWIGIGPGGQQQVDRERPGMRATHRAPGAGVEAWVAIGRDHLELAQRAPVVEGLDQGQGRAYRRPLAGGRYGEG
ncbi:hypothetical protein D3C76_1354440 [compost metagenome]